MAKSKVKWFDGKKGYGFILNPDGGEDIFVHFSSIISDQGFKVLNQDAEVEYDLEKTQKGYQAKSVRELSAPLDAVIPGVVSSTVRGVVQNEFNTAHH
ncbi:cold shock domain-containing protein [Chlorobaculum sp. 24CR]|uniref:cold-shock protein n=1 Tax=Chlorobaculum sp. 24CR TaxID=2508878 RepID=UPI00100B886E|nr:cold shock domain-containing protein [Chlorobaculum sp. 24CR]RXK82146.1 cold shock domain-containing protein [Chlorobaculum sp. 24CR]